MMKGLNPATGIWERENAKKKHFLRIYYNTIRQKHRTGAFLEKAYPILS
jgi:hypothetical protein